MIVQYSDSNTINIIFVLDCHMLLMQLNAKTDVLASSFFVIIISRPWAISKVINFVKNIFSIKFFRNAKSKHST